MEAMKSRDWYKEYKAAAAGAAASSRTSTATASQRASTPNPDARVSKRRWEYQMMLWRRALNPA